MHPILGHFEDAPIYSYGVFRMLSYLAAAALLPATSKRLGEPWTLGRIFTSGGSLFVHPAQLYALVLEVVILGLLFARPRRFPGELFLR